MLIAQKCLGLFLTPLLTIFGPQGHFKWHKYLYKFCFWAKWKQNSCFRNFRYLNGCFSISNLCLTIGYTQLFQALQTEGFEFSSQNWAGASRKKYAKLNLHRYKQCLITDIIHGFLDTSRL